MHWKGISFDLDPKVGIALLSLGHRENHMSNNIKCDVIEEWLTYIVQSTNYKARKRERESETQTDNKK